MEELLKNADDFLNSGKDNLIKKRYNVSVSDFFKLYTQSYNFSLSKDDAIKLGDYANELKDFVINKK